MRSTQGFFILILASLLLLACGSNPSATTSNLSASTVAVDLGQEGNASVAQRFHNYSDKPGGCSSTSNHPRVLISGFGLFAQPFNISGLVVDSLRSDSFWPSQVKLSDPISKNLRVTAAGKLSSSDSGGTTVNRTLTIDGRQFDVCLLLVDVQWDLAAAIIVHEMERFQPQLVVMTGVGGQEAVLEGGANNYTQWVGGFTSKGRMDDGNKPAGRVVNGVPDHDVLPWQDPGVQPTIAMTWDNQKLKTAIQSQVLKMGFSILAPAQARQENQYVCNNVSFVAAHALKGIRLNLAGGQIVLQPSISSHPQIGFFHYPAESTNTPQSVFSWAKIIATMIATALPAN